MSQDPSEQPEPVDQAEQTATDSPTEPAGPVLCVGGCGFWGSPATSNYCSQCWKKHLEEHPEEAPSPPPVESSEDGDVKMAEPPTEATEPAKPKQKNKKRCFVCRKKLNIAARFECKCGYIYCGLHRSPMAHECDFDYQTEHRNNLAKSNPLINHSKVGNI